MGSGITGVPRNRGNDDAASPSSGDDNSTDLASPSTSRPALVTGTQTYTYPNSGFGGGGQGGLGVGNQVGRRLQQAGKQAG